MASAAAAPTPDGPLPDMVSLEQAHAAEAHAITAEEHPFPTCYGCGPAHPTGLRMRSGPGRGHEHVCRDLDTAGRLPARGVGRARLPRGQGGRVPRDAHGPRDDDRAGLHASRVGEEHVVLSWSRGDDGRKRHAASALFTADGRLLARADQTWIALDPPTT